jgi:hypothetical protein
MKLESSIKNLIIGARKVIKYLNLYISIERYFAQNLMKK